MNHLVRYWLYIMLSVGSCSLVGCTQPATPIALPDFESGGILTLLSADPLPDSLLKKFEGVYSVVLGKQILGDFVVSKQTPGYLSFFNGVDAYIILRAGVIDSAIVFEGAGRLAFSDSTRLIRLILPAEKGGREILRGRASVTPAILLQSPDDATQPLEFRFARPLVDTTQNFMIFSHHGGRNEDRPPYSENSLNSIRFAERFGANGYEMDIRLTKDNIPILYHDETLNTRLVNGEYAVGPVANYTLSQLRSVATLRDGQQIPTLAEALDVAVRRTSLSYIWIDMKLATAVPYVIPIIQTYSNRALQLGRNITIMMGLPEADIADAYQQHPQAKSIKTMCELEESDVLRLGSAIWAPRWTLGTQSREIIANNFAQKGIKTVYWTVDEKDIMLKFLQDRTCNGLNTNRPYLLYYMYHINRRN